MSWHIDPVWCFLDGRALLLVSDSIADSLFIFCNLYDAAMDLLDQVRQTAVGFNSSIINVSKTVEWRQLSWTYQV
jgi:hypothetical protein